jgi:hypothetical protein
MRQRIQSYDSTFGKHKTQSITAQGRRADDDRAQAGGLGLRRHQDVVVRR